MRVAEPASGRALRALQGTQSLKCCKIFSWIFLTVKRKTLKLVNQTNRSQVSLVNNPKKSVLALTQASRIRQQTTCTALAMSKLLAAAATRAHATTARRPRGKSGCRRPSRRGPARLVGMTPHRRPAAPCRDSAGLRLQAQPLPSTPARRAFSSVRLVGRAGRQVGWSRSRSPLSSPASRAATGWTGWAEAQAGPCMPSKAIEKERDG